MKNLGDLVITAPSHLDAYNLLGGRSETSDEASRTIEALATIWGNTALKEAVKKEGKGNAKRT